MWLDGHNGGEDSPNERSADLDTCAELAPAQEARTVFDGDVKPVGPGDGYL